MQTIEFFIVDMVEPKAISCQFRAKIWSSTLCNSYQKEKNSSCWVLSRKKTLLFSSIGKDLQSVLRNILKAYLYIHIQPFPKPYFLFKLYFTGHALTVVPIFPSSPPLSTAHSLRQSPHHCSCPWVMDLSVHSIGNRVAIAKELRLLCYRVLPICTP